MSEKRTKVKSPRMSRISDSSTSSESTSSFSSGDEETDARDLKPIKEYLNNRRELSSQLFKSVKQEKIRLMLPQTLKKMNMYDLEEWCGSELMGMSRKRILSIINGQRMTESSNTDETDDSGPSLEIISDTEEWLTDDEVVIKEENLSHPKLKSMKSSDKLKKKMRTPRNKPKFKSKPSTNQGKDNKSANVSVKVEVEKEEPKEGESLLDLLELEMRARAIRALIRKEEDIIPDKPAASTSSGKKDCIDSVNVKSSGSKYVVQEMQQISVTLKQGSGLDDDVMLVIQPAPTIELLSSESENDSGKEKRKKESKRVNQLETENRAGNEEEFKRVNQRMESEGENEKEEQSKRVNKRLENERGTETTHSTSTIGDETVEFHDNYELKIAEQSPLYRGKNEGGSVVKVSEKFKSSEDLGEKGGIKVLDKSLKKVRNKSPDTTDKTPDKKSKTPERILDGAVDQAPNILTENITIGSVSKSTNEKEQIQDKETEKSPVTLEKAVDEPVKNSENDAQISEKSPEKELEEGELKSNSDSKDEDVVDVNAEKHFPSKRIRKRRHKRSKIHESSEENEVSHQSETADSGSEFNDKARSVSKEKQNLRKKIKVNAENARGINSKELVNENITDRDTTEDLSVKKEVELQKEVQRRREFEKKQEELDKADMEEIIDLDDYPDDMDELESTEQNMSNDLKKFDDNKPPLESNSKKAQPTETWASRYYNTDDVQNVIKESKIQSEIRKRLRERQRISKMSNSPNINTTGDSSPVDLKAEEVKQKAVGSVEEYLALKAATAVPIEPSVKEATEESSEKSGTPHKKGDSSHKAPSLKRRSKSDRKSAMDHVDTTSDKVKDDAVEPSAQLMPD